MNKQAGLLLFGAFLLTQVDVRGQIFIVVGSHNLLPNTPGQIVEIFVTGGAAVPGLNFNVQVADGYPSTTPPFFPSSSVDGPNITGVDLIGTVSQPTIFFANNSGPRVPVRSDPQLWATSITTGAGTVSANGRLALVTLDTTGWSGGTWAFALGNTQEGATDFAGTPATITDGSITVVPEPISTSIAGVLLLVGGFLVRARRAAH